MNSIIDLKKILLNKWREKNPIKSGHSDKKQKKSGKDKCMLI